MFQPTDFMDGQYIVVKDNIPYYRYTGVTYRDKLKNGLSLDYVFDQQESYTYPMTKDEEAEEHQSNTNFCIYADDLYDELDDVYIRSYCARKGKQTNLHKKRPKYTDKTYSVRSNGYTYKMFYHQQESPTIFETPKVDCYFWIHKYNKCYQFLTINNKIPLEKKMGEWFNQQQVSYKKGILTESQHKLWRQLLYIYFEEYDYKYEGRF